MILNSGSISKLLVAVSGAVMIALQTLTLHPAGIAGWVPTITAGITALMTYLVPNTPTSTVTTPAVETVPEPGDPANIFSKRGNIG